MSIKDEYSAYRGKVREMMLLTDRRGMATEDLAERLSLSNRQVGRVMSMFIRRGLVMRHPKGIVVLTDPLTGKPEPCYFNNSYYEWIGE